MYLTGINNYSANSGCRPLITPSDISLKHEDSDAKTAHQLLGLTKLVIFGLEDETDGKSFPLIQAGPGAWKIEGSIEL